MPNYLTNAFSLNMLPVEGGALTVNPVIDATNWIGEFSPVNAIGHPDTDRIVRAVISADGHDLPEGQRLTVALAPGDRCLVAQYRGPRLPEGAMALPYGATINFMEVIFN